MNTAAVPQVEYHVETECGRNFCWSANDMEHLFRQLHDRCYRATRVLLQSEYEAEQEELRRIQSKLKELDAA